MVAGDDFNKYNVSKFNPKGYWELEIDELKFLNDPEVSKKYDGCAVKIVGNLLRNIIPGDIEKIIYITRNKNEAVESIYKFMLDSEYFVKMLSNTFADLLFDECYNEALKFIRNNNGMPVLKLHYNDFIGDPQKWVCKIKNFLNIDCDCTKAIENIGA